MRRLLVPLLFVLAALQGFSAQAPQKIKPGDVLTVLVYNQDKLSGDFTVQNDGAIYCPGVGRVVVGGMTVEAAEGRYRTKVGKVLKSPEFNLLLKSANKAFIYAVGGKAPEGAIPYQVGLDLRSVIAQAQLPDDPDFLSILIYREGHSIATVDPHELLQGKSGWDGPLLPDDVVVIERRPYLRVWVLGDVSKPGQQRVQAGDDIYRAVALAGDIKLTNEKTETRADYDIVVKRGPTEIRLPGRPVPAAEKVVAEAGDTIYVEAANFTVTVAGEVKTPGDFEVRHGTPIAVAVGKAGGITPTGTLVRVLVFHNGEARYVRPILPTDKTTETGANQLVAPNDIIFVPRAEKSVYILGDVTQPNRYPLREDRVYHLYDTLALSGGLLPTGTLRRVTLIRADSSGRVVATKYNLDEFLKDAKVGSNPELKPDDVIFFGTPKGFTANGLITGLSGILLLDTLVRHP